MASVKTMLEQLRGMVGSDDLTEWENSFVEDVYDRYSDNTTNMSSKQVETVERIWSKHFA